VVHVLYLNMTVDLEKHMVWHFRLILDVSIVFVAQNHQVEDIYQNR
jgi:hypothetical protein